MIKPQTLFKLLMFIALSLSIFSCAKTNGAEDYISVQVEDSKMWSLLNIHTGDLEMTDEFFAPSTNVVQGSFFVENDNKDFDLYNLKDTKNKINRSSYSIVTNFNKDGFAIVRVKDEPWQIIDYQGTTVATLDKNLMVLSGFTDDGLALIMNKDHMIGYVDTKGETPIKPRYKFGTIFSDGVAFVLTKQEENHNYFSAIDPTGKTIFTFSDAKYSDIGLFNDGHMFAVEGDHSVLLDKQGKKIMNVCSGTNISDLSYSNGKMIYYDGQFYGVKNTEDKILIRAKYKLLKFQSDGQLLAKNSNDKFGVITTDDSEVMPFDYDVLEYLAPERYLTKSGNVYVLIDNSGKEICDKAFNNYLNRSSSSSESNLASLVSAPNNSEAAVEVDDDNSLESFILNLSNFSDYEITEEGPAQTYNGEEMGLQSFISGPAVNDYPEHFFGNDDNFRNYLSTLADGDYIVVRGEGIIDTKPIDVYFMMNKYGTIAGRYHNSNGTNLDLNGYVNSYTGELMIKLGHENNGTLSNWYLTPIGDSGSGYEYRGSWGKSNKPSSLRIWISN